LRSIKQTQHALPQERTRANAKGAELCDAGSNATHLAGCRTVIHLGSSPIARPKSIPENAASITRVISRSTAPAADMAKKPNGILQHTGSTKTDSDSNCGKEILMDVYRIITERIIQKLEAGCVPWHKAKE
jgi:hypothetical protein